MPISYRIDKERRIVVSIGTGVLNREEVQAQQKLVLADPDFDPSYSQLIDFTGVTKFNLNAQDVRQLAQRSVFAPDARRAFVVASDLAFGLARMYEMHREGAGEESIRIFRDTEEALDWVLAKTAAS